ncbi:MAG TPA: biotin carboxylase N-terminal domain-containing protein [Steroidobacteraceae bacterium]|nr:biotin carboxylase N-terminal domain-containing protein [Steroidobacteraceae bacterium]
MRMQRVLIANRGEIAVRIIRTCNELGIETILAASEADVESVPARLADRTVCIGPPQPARSYLDVEAVVGAAVSVRADALHPGYGFLAENSRLARRCAEAGVTFIGPTPEQLDALGDKLRARQHALDAGLPILPGQAVASLAEAQDLAHRIGWPILIKSVGGGGGRGLKPARDATQLSALLDLAMAEAHAAFGDARVYLERLVESGRHVEVQILGDGVEVIHLGDRDCSVQRRYQKLIEEAPAPDLPAQVRAAMHAAAVRLGRHLRYRGLGTVEFLFDRVRQEFYFLEMNARIQVEHPVTEAITGLDLVAQQIAVAQGQRLALTQEEVEFRGHALECRITAEDWRRDFAPSPGRITSAVFPAGEHVRVDTHIEHGSTVPPFYDSLLAKIVVHGRDRPQSVERMRQALANCHIAGVATNVELHAQLLEDPEFFSSAPDTATLGRWLARRPA